MRSTRDAEHARNVRRNPCPGQRGGERGRVEPACVGARGSLGAGARRTLRGHSSTLPARKSEPAARCCHGAKGQG